MEQRNVSGERLQKYIEELIACEALELLRCPEMSPDDLYIPYMMNDALEYYLILKNCTVIGERTGDFPADTAVEAVQHQGAAGIIIRRANGMITTLWYQSCQSVLQLYQYHRIGHFWRRGQEQWRQLVYVIGTIYDKQQYIGDRVCNQLEQELLPLITFAPFRYWSPIDEDLDAYYPDTPEGVQCMKMLARQAGDRKYLRMLRVYQLLTQCSIVPKKKLIRHLAQALTQPERTALYALMFEKVEQASACYPERNYGEKYHAKMEQTREQLVTDLQNLGFQGEYPLFHRKGEQVLAMEEHPFTVSGLDYEGFSFRIQLMVSRSIDGKSGLNTGFFQGRGEVLQNVSDLKNTKEQRL